MESISFWVKIGYYSCFYPECNTKRCYIESLSTKTHDAILPLSLADLVISQMQIDAIVNLIKESAILKCFSSVIFLNNEQLGLNENGYILWLEIAIGEKQNTLISQNFYDNRMFIGAQVI